MSSYPFPVWSKRPRFVYRDVDFYVPQKHRAEIESLMSKHRNFLTSEDGRPKIDWIYYSFTNAESQEDLIFLLLAADILSVEDGDLMIHSIKDPDDFYGPTLCGIQLGFHPSFIPEAKEYFTIAIDEAEKEGNFFLELALSPRQEMRRLHVA